MSRRNSRHDRFAREYIKDLNGTRAAIAAGYSKKGARVTGSKLLSNPNVQSLLRELTEKQAIKLDLSAEVVLDELKKMGLSNMMDYIETTADGGAVVDLSALTRDHAAAVQEVTVDTYMDGKGEDAREVKRIKFKLADKNRSLELLGKHLKLFTEKIEITGLDKLAESIAEARKRAG